MSDWITDRRPTEEDADYLGCVWTTIQDGRVVRWSYDGVAEQGTPWMPITPPAPYVKPKRWTVRYLHHLGYWTLYIDSEVHFGLLGLNRNSDEHREAAERIAAIYEEMLP